MDRGPGSARRVRPCRRRIMAFGGLLCLAVAALVPATDGQPRVLDDFDTLDAWRVTASEGVEATITPDQGPHGPALRFDYHFRSGAGFCVVRRELPLTLDENYRFAFDLRGAAPANNLEFKLVDESGENVWWENRRAYQPPRDWQTLATPKRRLQFAWGPSGGAPLKQISAIEFAVASATGGRGSLWIDRLTYQPLSAANSSGDAAQVTFSSDSEVTDTTLDLPANGQVRWSTADGVRHAEAQIDLGAVREVGGLAVGWADEHYARAYEIALSDDGQAWTPAVRVERGDGGNDYVALPNAQARYVRLAIPSVDPERGIEIRRLRVPPPEFAESPNALWRTVAADAPRGRYPRHLLGEQVVWTVAGAPADDFEALLDADGALEVDRGAFRIEPFLRIGDAFVTWADVEAQPSLANGDLPIPSVTWRPKDSSSAGVSLEVTALVEGPAGAAVLRPAYRIVNTSDIERSGTLFLAIRPFQVLPPWHELNLVGGAARVESVDWDGRALKVNARHAVYAAPAPNAVNACAFADGDIVAALASDRLPVDVRAADPNGFASAVLRFDFALAPGAETLAVLAVPFANEPAETRAKRLAAPDSATAIEEWRAAYRRVSEDWQRALNRVELRLPPIASRLGQTFRTVQGHILINADGPRIQPGSRTYERSWIRDGALTSTALLYTGHAEQVRAFLDWYAPHQFESGKVPCVVDRRGPDPVPEHDSTGQLIYALLKYYEFTRDRAFLERHLPRVVRGVEYIEALRSERMTSAYREGPAEMRARYGLVPESISHEGYSAKPMHSYWDNFFVWRGLKDATTIAQTLKRPELAERFERLHAEYERCLAESVRLAMTTHQIEFIPGCVELGDFDATSTAIALFPCGARHVLPTSAVAATFDRYYRFFCDRRDRRLEWRNYTPYEVRLINTFLRLEQPDRAHDLINFFLADQHPQEWNQWGEVVWRDPAFPGFVGDMPHTWVGSDFLSAARSLFVYEREADDALVLAAGVRAEWLDDADTTGGVRIRAFPTPYGSVSYSLRRAGHDVRLELETAFERAPAAVVVFNPTGRAITRVTANGEVIEAFTPRAITLAGVGPQTSVMITLAAE